MQSARRATDHHKSAPHSAAHSPFFRSREERGAGETRAVHTCRLGPHLRLLLLRLRLLRRLACEHLRRRRRRLRRRTALGPLPRHPSRGVGLLAGLERGVSLRHHRHRGLGGVGLGRRGLGARRLCVRERVTKREVERVRERESV
jgi:hypothetical protein